MMNMIESGKADSIVCWKLDRLARNMTEGGKIIDLLSSGKIKAIITHDKVFYPWDNVIVMSVEFSQGKQFVKDLSINVKRGQAKKASMGYPHGMASIGFINDKTEEKGNRKWLVDENRLYVIKELFRLFLSGNWSIRKLARYARDELKLTTVKHKRIGGALISISRMNEILKDPIYMGYFYQCGIEYELSKELPRIITKDEYIKIQNMISNRDIPKTQEHDVVYSGYISSPEGDYIGQDVKYQIICDCKFKFSYCTKKVCPKCNTKISQIENPKYLVYRYYYNVKRRKSALKTSYLSEKVVDTYLSNYLKENLQFSPELAEWYKKHISELKDHDVSRNKDIQNNNINVIEQLQAKKKRIRKLLLDNYISPEEYQSEISDLETEIKSFKPVATSSQELSEEGDKIIDLTRIMYEKIVGDDLTEKRDFLSKLGSNLVWNEEILNIINTKPIQALIDGIKKAKEENPLFEPSTTLANEDQTDIFNSVCPTLLPG
jgi:site-specific DNA recombinase